MKTNMILQKFCGFLVVITGLLLSGCASTSDKSQAVALAEQEVRKRGWEDFKITNVQRSDGGWRVTLHYIPPTPGGHADVLVKNGKVAAYYGGK